MFPLASSTAQSSNPNGADTETLECKTRIGKDLTSLNCTYNEDVINYSSITRVDDESVNRHQSSKSNCTNTNNCFCNLAEKVEEKDQDNWDLSTSNYNVSYHFLSEEEEGNDRGCGCDCSFSDINSPSSHYDRPLSTTSKLSSSVSCMGGVEPESQSQSVSLLSPALKKMPSSYLPESKTARFATQQSLSFSAEDSSISSACNKRNTFSRSSQSQSCSSSSSSSSSERSNETPSSSLQSLPFISLEETSCIATSTSVNPEESFTTPSVEYGNITGNQNKPSTSSSIWALAAVGTDSKRSATNINSSRASSLFSAPLLAENQISPTAKLSQIPNESSAPYKYYNISDNPTLSFTKSSQPNKKKVKTRTTRAGNKTDFPSDYSTQSATNFHNRWIFASTTASDDKLQKQHKNKTSYSYYIGKIKKFHQNIISAKNSDKSNRVSKIKHCSSKVNDSSSVNTSQIIPTTEQKTKNIPYTVMDNEDSNKFYHLKSQPTIKITVSPDTPDMENQNSQKNTIEFETMKNTVANKIYIGNSSDSTTFSVEDFSRLDFPNCVDFGITDFLCCRDEVDVDLSSDTDTSYLEATPPHRFSDSELEQIEAMSITLDTALNLNPKMDFLNSVAGSDGKKAISAPPEMEESEATKEFLEKDLIFTLKQLQANNLMKKSGNGNDNGNARKVLPKPFRRHISLPATVFMRYIFDHDNKAAESTNDSQRNNRLPKINSISGSSTENIYEDSCSCSNDNDSDSISNISNDWVSKSDSIDLEQEEFENQAFTSDIEKRSLIVRHMRRLIRQDTSGNFAPPDFSLQC